MSEVVCPRCGRNNSDLAKRCQGCGLDLSELSESSGIRRPDMPSDLSMPPRNLMHRGIPTLDVSASDAAMLGGDWAGKSDAPTLQDGDDVIDAEERDPIDESRINPIPGPPRSRLFRFGRTVSVVAFLIVAIGAFWLGLGRYIWPVYQVSAQIIRNNQGEFIELSVHDPEPGTLVRFGGEQMMLNDEGRARFSYYVQGLSFGKNDLDVNLTLPSHQQLNRRVVIDIPFRILPFWHRFDFETRMLPIHVQAYSGTQLTINGVTVSVDDHQQEPLAIPVAYHDGAWEDWIAFRTEAERKGKNIFDGTLRLYTKKAGLTLLAPPMEAVTDQASLVVVGQVGANAEVLVQQKSVPVTNGSFEMTVQLPTQGVQQIEVIVREQGFLPNRMRIPVTRVESLREAYAEYRTDADINWKSLWAEPAKFVGTRVELSGAVRQVISSQGGVVFELQVEPCVGSDECLFWVNYPLSRTLKTGEQVHVRGRVAGERPTYTDGQGKTMRNRPLLEAAFVLQQSN